MNSNNLSDALLSVNEDFIDESDPSKNGKKKKPPVWVLPLAASFAVVVALSILIARGIVNNKKLPVEPSDSACMVESTTALNEENTTDGTENPSTTDGEKTTYGGANRSNGSKTEKSKKDDTYSKPGSSDGTTVLKPSETKKPDETKKTETTTEKTSFEVIPTEPTTIDRPGGDKPFKPETLEDSQEYLDAVTPYVISRHRYPSYPLHYIIPDGTNKDTATRYREYSEAQKYKRQFIGAWKPATGFIKDSTSVFLTEKRGENAVYSPANVFLALSLMSETTGGNTRNQILSALNANDISSLRSTANGIWNFNYTNDGLSQCLLGNSIWLNDKLSYNKDTLDFIAENYYASSFSGEMGSEGYNKAFRQWINSSTGNLLGDQVNQLKLEKNTEFALASTILFKARWIYPFSPKRTSAQPFTTPTGVTSVDFMHLKLSESTLNYGDKFTASTLLFDSFGGMDFILPDEGYTPESLMNDPETLEYIVTKNSDWSKSKQYDINYSVPKFDVSSQLELIPGLEKLGITDCFDSSKSDFTPMGEHITGSFSSVKHGARVVIDEEGVIAAAYTVDLMIGGIPQDKPDYDFTLDRPFIFVIRSVDGMPLFIGIVNNP